VSTVKATRLAFVVLVGLLGSAAACSNGVPLGPTNTSTSTGGSTPAATPPPPATPTHAPPATSSSAVAYTPDLQPIFDSDCTPCHGGRSPAARYSTASYAGVMAAVQPGSAASALAVVTRPGGFMYAFFSGDRAAKSAAISQWILNGAPERR